MRRWNWPLWTGLALSIIALISYLTFFARFPITRDVPWANLLLFGAAMVLLVVGVRRASRKIVPGIVMTLGIAIFLFFGFAITVASKQLPLSLGAPHVGQKAPDFTLVDTNRKPVSLSNLLASAPRGVLLVFYRGYW